MEVSCHYLLFCFLSVSTSEHLGALVAREGLKCPHLPATTDQAAAEPASEVLEMQKKQRDSTHPKLTEPHRGFVSSLLVFNYSRVVLEEQTLQH